MRDIIQTVNDWLKQDQAIALATVVQTWGSAPRGVGSMLAVKPDLSMVGSVSGGCVENAVIEEGLAGLKDGQPRLLTFGVADDIAWEVGLTCGGKISVFVEQLDQRWWKIAGDRVQNDQSLVTITILEGELAGSKLVIDATGNVLYVTEGLGDQLIAELREAAQSQKISSQNEVAGHSVMIDVIGQRPHLIIIGGVHVAMPLTTMAQQVGFRVSIVDPRSAFATEARFPTASAILHSYPAKALPQLGLNRETFLAVLTHDPKIDDQSLIAGLQNDVAYIGVLSSSRTHEKRVQRLKNAGITDKQLERIRTPIGIDIGARTPEEIALCIMAEIVAVRNGALE